jgi:lipoate-protein ligase A
MNRWFFLNSQKNGAAFNMAADEALLEFASQISQPVLRFYGWNEPAATFGYFQKISEVESATLLRPLIRRPTGGGIVPHAADWTYSFAVPPSHEWHSLKAETSYRRIHEWIQLAFTELKVETELAPCCRKTLPGQCFAGHEKFDLLWRGKKIAGAAQRRNKSGLLIQGSIQPPPIALKRAGFELAMITVAQKNFGVTWQEFLPAENFATRVNFLAHEKFSQDNFNRRR